MIKVTVFNEYMHEQTEDAVRAIYPNGIHGAIADFLGNDEIEVRTVTLYDENKKLIEDCGLTDEVLADTDVIVWWGHMCHADVPDAVVDKVYNQILCGMGGVFLHSAHHSKLFKKLMGTSCHLHWRDNEKERLWNICPSHPIMRGIGDYFDIPQEEMYGECFQIPQPDELLMIGTYGSHEVFRSACTWQRVNGKIFYFQPGHEAYPTYYIPEVQTVIRNAIYWAAPTYREEELVCPESKVIEF